MNSYIYVLKNQTLQISNKENAYVAQWHQHNLLLYILGIIRWKLKLFPNSPDPDLWPVTLKNYILKCFILLSLHIWSEPNWLKTLASISCNENEVWRYIHALSEFANFMAPVWSCRSFFIYKKCAVQFSPYGIWLNSILMWSLRTMFKKWDYWFSHLL